VLVGQPVKSGPVRGVVVTIRLPMTGVLAMRFVFFCVFFVFFAVFFVAFSPVKNQHMRCVLAQSAGVLVTSVLSRGSILGSTKSLFLVGLCQNSCLTPILGCAVGSLVPTVSFKLHFFVVFLCFCRFFISHRPAYSAGFGPICAGPPDHAGVSQCFRGFWSAKIDC